MSTTSQARPRALTAHDRCDRCGAQAFMRAELPAGELLFCGHHAQEHRPALRALRTAFIQDETHRAR